MTDEEKRKLIVSLKMSSIREVFNNNPPPDIKTVVGNVITWHWTGYKFHLWDCPTWNIDDLHSQLKLKDPVLK